ncbi:MAG TPA: hypothetical protein VK034_13600 [Enhygromyxa sp.]|nr:hypothetical protein [Enhygromyxa sp.]
MATATHYDPDMSVLAARTRYFTDNEFGDDGGYSSRWVTLARLGPVKLGFPNTAARVRAVSRHDLHHLVTGYDTDFLGEAEVAAWELASDCRDFRAAWVLNLLAMPIGMLRNPARVRRAFARGCSSKNLYGEPFTEQLLQERLGDLRARLGVDAAANSSLTGAQRRRFRWMLAVGVLGQLAILAILGALLAGLAIGVGWLIG